MFLYTIILEFYTKTTVSVYSFLTLITANKVYFSTRKVTGADQARNLYRKFGYLGYQH